MIQAFVFNPDGTVNRSVEYLPDLTVIHSNGLMPGAGGASSGRLVQVLRHEITDGWDPAQLVWEAQLQDATGKVHTLKSGTLTVLADRIRSLVVPEAA